MHDIIAVNGYIPGGCLVSFLGSDAQNDLKGCQDIMEENSLIIHRQIPYILPGKRSKRNTVIFKKN